MIYEPGDLVYVKSMGEWRHGTVKKVEPHHIVIRVQGRAHKYIVNVMDVEGNVRPR